MANVAPPGKSQFLDNNGNPLAGGLVYTYEAGGTSVPRATWADADENTENENPIELDAAGRAPIYWRGNYNVVVHDANDALVYSIDNFNVPDISAANAAIQFQEDGANESTAGAFTTLNFAKGITLTPSGTTLTIEVGDDETVTFGGLVLNGSDGLDVSGGPVDLNGVEISSSGIITGCVQPCFHATRHSTQTSGTTVIFDTEKFDVGGVYNNTTGVFTAPVAGTYLLMAVVHHRNGAGANSGRIFSLVGSTAGRLATALVNSLADVVAGTIGNGSLFAVAQLAASETVSVDVESAFTSDEMLYGDNTLGAVVLNSFSAYLLG